MFCKQNTLAKKRMKTVELSSANRGTAEGYVHLGWNPIGRIDIVLFVGFSCAFQYGRSMTNKRAILGGKKGRWTWTRR
jgi:hypothetical protein